MAETIDFAGDRFFHSISVKPGTAIKHSARTQEIDEPFRFSNSTVIRLWPFNKAVVIGRWQDSGLDEKTALFRATHITGTDGFLGGEGWDVDTDDQGDIRLG